MDQEELKKIWKENAQGVYRFLIRLTRNEAEAADLLQEVFCRILRRPEVLSGIQSVRPYLLRLARNAAIDRLRHEQMRQRALEAIGLQDAGKVAAAFDPDLKVLRRALADALQQLPEAQRQVVHARLWKQQTLEQIAGGLGVSLNTAASRYRYGLDKMRGALRVLYEELISRSSTNLSHSHTMIKNRRASEDADPIIRPLEPRRVPSATGSIVGLHALPINDDVDSELTEEEEVPEASELLDLGVESFPILQGAEGAQETGGDGEEILEDSEEGFEESVESGTNAPSAGDWFGLEDSQEDLDLSFALGELTKSPVAEITEGITGPVAGGGEDLVGDDDAGNHTQEEPDPVTDIEVGDREGDEPELNEMEQGPDGGDEQDGNDDEFSGNWFVTGATGAEINVQASETSVSTVEEPIPLNEQISITVPGTVSEELPEPAASAPLDVNPSPIDAPSFIESKIAIGDRVFEEFSSPAVNTRPADLSDGAGEIGAVDLEMDQPVRLLQSVEHSPEASQPVGQWVAHPEEDLLATTWEGLEAFIPLDRPEGQLDPTVGSASLGMAVLGASSIPARPKKAKRE